jgi:hypothetical protein
MAEMSGSASTDDREVIVARLYDPGNPANGSEELVLVHGPESEARRVYAGAVAMAADKQYEYVNLRSDGRDVEWWPPPTGWTS